MKHHINTVTVNGMTPSQPGVSVSVTSPVYESLTSSRIVAACELSVTRHYRDLPNKYGGKGKFKKLDGYGKKFDSTDEAWAWALEHGYIRPWFREYDPQRKERQRQLFCKYEAPKKGLVKPE